VLRKVLKTMREEIRGNLRKLYNEELHDLHLLSNTVGRTRWARHEARSVSERQRERSKMQTEFWCGNLKGSLD
jgi:hypothetical protein